MKNHFLYSLLLALLCRPNYGTQSNERPELLVRHTIPTPIDPSMQVMRYMVCELSPLATEDNYSLFCDPDGKISFIEPPEKPEGIDWVTVASGHKTSLLDYTSQVFDEQLSIPLYIRVSEEAFVVMQDRKNAQHIEYLPLTLGRLGRKGIAYVTAIRSGLLNVVQNGSEYMLCEPTKASEPLSKYPVIELTIMDFNNPEQMQQMKLKYARLGLDNFSSPNRYEVSERDGRVFKVLFDLDHNKLIIRAAYRNKSVSLVSSMINDLSKLLCVHGLPKMWSKGFDIATPIKMTVRARCRTSQLDKLRHAIDPDNSCSGELTEDFHTIVRYMNLELNTTELTLSLVPQCDSRAKPSTELVEIDKKARKRAVAEAKKEHSPTNPPVQAAAYKEPEIVKPQIPLEAFGGPVPKMSDEVKTVFESGKFEAKRKAAKPYIAPCKGGWIYALTSEASEELTSLLDSILSKRDFTYSFKTCALLSEFIDVVNRHTSMLGISGIDLPQGIDPGSKSRFTLAGLEGKLYLRIEKGSKPCFALS